jgi:hypothetical protein
LGTAHHQWTCSRRLMPTRTSCCPAKRWDVRGCRKTCLWVLIIFITLCKTVVCRSWTKESHGTSRANDLVCRFSDYKDGSSSSSFFWCSTKRIMTLGQFQWPGHLKRPNLHSF